MRSPSPSSSSRTAANSTPTATGCWAPFTTQTTRSRKHCWGPGRGGAASRAAARCAPGSTRSPRTPACEFSRGASGASCPEAPDAGRSARAARRAPGRVGLDRALSGRAPALREPGGRRARLRRRPSAPAAQPARRADPARGARLQRSGGCRDPRDLGRLGEQRPAAGPREARAGAPGPLAAGDAAGAGRRALPQARRPFRRRLEPRRRRGDRRDAE